MLWPLLIAAGIGALLIVSRKPRAVSPEVVSNETIDPHALYDRTAALVADLNTQGVAQVRLVTVDGAGHGFAGRLLDVWRAEMRKELS